MSGEAPEPIDEATSRLRQDYAASLDNRVQAAALGVLALSAILYPFAVQWLVAHLGLRMSALGLTLIGVASSLAAGNRLDRYARVGTTALAAGAMISGKLLPLLLLPACLYLGLAMLFFRSLRDQRSLVELAAQWIQPAAPAFIAPYCRRVTALWGTVFTVNAVVLAVAAVTASVDTWRALAGYATWGWMGAISLAEFLVRKSYFRNYWYRGPFERFWSRLFPAEATPMGRRSAEHIRTTRRKLGLPD